MVAIDAFNEALGRAHQPLDAARSALIDSVGKAGFVEAAGIVGIFNGLVRNADFSGIPLDEGTLHGSADFRDALGLDAFGGAANTEVERGDPALAPSRFLGPPAR